MLRGKSKLSNRSKGKKVMFILVGIILFLFMLVYIFLQTPRFGRLPKGERLERILNSPNYKDGSFQNREKNPVKPEWEGVKTDNIDTGKKRTPVDDIPTKKTDLYSLSEDEDVIIWFGHSSCYLQIDGKKVLIDPVFSSYASPVFFISKAFNGTDIYSPDDIPEIDYLFISHDHWDHLDYKTVKALRKKVKKVVCGLGVSEHFERWGYSMDQIIELDWDEMAVLDEGFVVHAKTAHHFSGRGLSRNKSLWISFVFETPTSRLFYSGDGGYASHFAQIGEEFDGFDLVIMENGQYDDAWPESHMTPEEMMTAVMDLGAKKLLPVHSGKFCICRHPWDEPLERISELCSQTDIRLKTPMIGEVVYLRKEGQKFSEWWKNVQ